MLENGPCRFNEPTGKPKLSKGVDVDFDPPDILVQHEVHAGTSLVLCQGNSRREIDADVGSTPHIDGGAGCGLYSMVLGFVRTDPQSMADTST